MKIDLLFFFVFLFFKKLVFYLLVDLNFFLVRVNWFLGVFSMWFMMLIMLFFLLIVEYVLFSFFSFFNSDIVMLMLWFVKCDVFIVCWNSCFVILFVEFEI